MSSPFPSLDLIPAFHAVMTQGSLSGAARALGLAQPTVRRHIEMLEAALAAPLFTRATNGLTPTDMAHGLLPQAEAVLAEARAFARAASGKQDSLEGSVRVTCSRIVAVHVLPDIIASLRATAPRLSVEVAASDRTEDLLRRAADIAIRFAPPQQNALKAAKLPDVAVGLFAGSGAYANARPADIAQLPMVVDDQDARLVDGLVAMGLPAPENVVLRSDDPLVQIAAIQARIGIGVCQVKLARRLGLTRVLPHSVYPMPAWLVMHEDQSRSARIRHVFDLLKTQLPQRM